MAAQKGFHPSENSSTGWCKVSPAVPFTPDCHSVLGLLQKLASLSLLRYYKLRRLRIQNEHDNSHTDTRCAARRVAGEGNARILKVFGVAWGLYRVNNLHHSPAEPALRVFPPPWACTLAKVNAQALQTNQL